MGHFDSGVLQSHGAGDHHGKTAADADDSNAQATVCFSGTLMMTQSAHARRLDIWAARFAFAWGFLMMATNLDVGIPHIQWFISGACLVIGLPYLLRIRWRTFPARIPACLLVLAVCFPTIYGANLFYSLAEAGKLAVMLLGALSIFVARPQLAYYAFRGFVAAVWLNVLLLIGGFLGFSSAEMMMRDRWGTVLSYPGYLWRVGASVWIFAAFMLIKRHSRTALGLLLASTLLVYADGTRTGILLLLAGALYVTLILVIEAGQFRKAILVSAMGLGVLGLSVWYSGIFSGEAGGEGKGAVGRFTELATSVGTQGVGGLEAADVVRFQMLQDVATAIRDHPLFGTGFETTTSDTVLGTMSIHMTYLQLWADLGILGILAYVCLVWGWIIWLPKLVPLIKRRPDPEVRAIYYNAIFVLFSYAFSGFLHTVSTEWADWSWFMVPYALLWALIRSHAASRDRYASVFLDEHPRPRFA
jgi:O-antigen ligase